MIEPAARAMSASKKNNISAEKLELYARLAATIPDIQRKGATVPYTSLNGNMFSYLHSSGVLALRLPEGERVKFLKKYKTNLVEVYGIVQKEYVTVPDALLENTAELKPYFLASYGYANSLKPKPSKKKS